MTLETFFEKFDQFADAPDAVAKMRELVLELAVQGKLSDQRADDADETAWIKIGEHLDDSTSFEIEPPFSIPSSWKWVTLEKLGDTKPRNDAAATARCSFVPMTLIPVEYGRGVQHEERPWGEIKKGYTHFQNADVVMAKITPCFENGKSTLMKGLTGGFGAGTTELHVFRRNGAHVLQEFVLIYLKSSGFITRGIPRMTGSAGQKRVPHDYFARSPFPLPPLAEQKRIVAKVDELMTLCDRLEAQQQEREEHAGNLARASLARFAAAPTPVNLNFLFHKSYHISPADLRKSILTLAVQGKLVPQDPNDEPAEELLVKIAGAIGVKTARKLSLVTELTATRPFELPNGWAWSRFSELGQFGRGKSKNRPRNDPKLFIGGTHPLVQTGDVARSNGTIQTFTGLYNEVGLAQSKKWPAGTLCITIAANIADSGILGFDACFPDSIVGFIPATAIPSVRYFEYFLRTAKERLEAFAPSTAQKNINVGILEQVSIPIPPAAEQRRIVAKVDQLMALVDELETQMAASRATAEKLLGALVAELTSPGTEEKAETKIIHLHSTPEFIRAQLAAEIVERLHDHESFGQTKFQKIINLAEYLLQLPEIDSHPLRFARGPHDPELIEQVETKMKQCEWFERLPRDGGVGWKYVPLAKAGGHRALFEKQWPEKAARIRALIDQMKTWPTERCERFATVYAAWNDLIIWKKPVTDKSILREVLEHWHPDKENIPKSKWQETLEWMRREGHIPTGFGLPTKSSPTAELFL